MPGSTEELHKLNDKINTLTSVRGCENASAAGQASHSSLGERLPRNQVYTEVGIRENTHCLLIHCKYKMLLSSNKGV